MAKLSEIFKKDYRNKKYPLYKLERKINFNELMIFIAVNFVMILICFVVYPIFKDSFADVVEVTMPYLDMSLSSYYTTQVLMSWVLIGTIYAAVLGFQLVTNNFKNSSSNLLYTLNLSRNQILNAKLLRLVVNIAIFNAASALFSLIGLLALGINEINFANFFLSALMCLLVCLIIGLISFALSALFTKKYSMFTSIIIPVFLLLLSNISLISNKLVAFDYFTPLSLTMKNITENGFSEINFIIVGIWSVIALGLLALGYITFNKKDLV